MKKTRFLLPKLLLSAIVSAIGVYFILFYPGYLQNTTLSNCVMTMGFKALNCGRALYLLTAAAGTALFFISVKRWTPDRQPVQHIAAGSLLFCIVFFFKNYSSYQTADRVQLALLSLVSGVYCGLVTPALLFLIGHIRSIADRVLSIDYAAILKKIWKKHKVPFISAVIAGFLAYTWLLTNKLLNLDEISFLFSKGATIHSGRWGLDLISLIFPDYSMPWLWGAITIFVLAVSCCIIVDTFQIRNVFLQAVLPAVIITFPAQTGTMFYMFTTTGYACAFLMSATVVHILCTERRNKKAVLLAVLLEIFSLSIYQAYITVVSSLLVSLCIIEIYKGNKTVREVLIDSLYYVVFLFISAALYYILNIVILNFCNESFNGYASGAINPSGNILNRIAEVYSKTYQIFDSYKYGIVTSGVSKIAHIALLIFILVQGMAAFGKRKEKWVYAAYVVIILPLSINGLVLLLSKQSLHTLTLYSYAALYVLAGALAEEMLQTEKQNRICNAVALVIAVIVSSNILFANEQGLQQYLEYENTYSIYQSVITQIQELPEFNETSKIAFIGDLPDGAYREHFKKVDGFPATYAFRRMYPSDSRAFLSTYLGFDLQYPTSEELDPIYDSEEYEKMASYPYNGYIRAFDDIIVVKFS